MGSNGKVLSTSDLIGETSRGYFRIFRKHPRELLFSSNDQSLAEKWLEDNTVEGIAKKGGNYTKICQAVRTIGNDKHTNNSQIPYK